MQHHRMNMELKFIQTKRGGRSHPELDPPPTTHSRFQWFERNNSIAIGSRQSKFLDLLVKVIAVCGVVPLAFMVLFLSVMATDSGTTASKLGAFGLLILGGSVCCLIMFSAFAEAKWLSLQSNRNKILIKLPAYLFLPFSIWLLWNILFKHLL